MNPSLLGALAAFLVVLLWWRSRLRPALPLVRDGDTSAVAALNRAQIALVQAGGARGRHPAGADAEGSSMAGSSTSGSEADTDGTDLADPVRALAALVLPPPHDSHRQRLYRLRLQRGFQAGGRQRREAIRQARRWGHPSILPLLRLGLRATDPIVVQEAAAGLNRFRSRPVPSPQPAAIRPRSVARTR